MFLWPKYKSFHQKSGGGCMWPCDILYQWRWAQWRMCHHSSLFPLGEVHPGCQRHCYCGNTCNMPQRCHSFSIAPQSTKGTCGPSQHMLVHYCALWCVGFQAMKVFFLFIWMCWVDFTQHMLKHATTHVNTTHQGTKVWLWPKKVQCLQTCRSFRWHTLWPYSI